MNNIIEKLLKKITKGVAFDSHFIIKQIQVQYSEDYAKFFKKKTPATNGRIGKEIKKFENKLVKKLPIKSYSENIHRTSSKCTLWEKI